MNYVTPFKERMTHFFCIGYGTWHIQFQSSMKQATAPFGKFWTMHGNCKGPGWKVLPEGFHNEFQVITTTLHHVTVAGPFFDGRS